MLSFVRHSIFFLFAILLHSIFWLAQPSHAATGTPEECLLQINQAVDEADTATFQNLVDIDAILNDSLDKFLNEIQKPENASMLPPILALIVSRATDSKAFESIRQLLVEEARSFVLNGVENGSFAGKKLPLAQSRGFLAPLFANVSTGRKEIRNIGHAGRDGDYFLTPFVVHDFDNGNDYPIVGRFSTASGQARLVGIENLDQLFEQFKKESDAQ